MPEDRGRQKATYNFAESSLMDRNSSLNEADYRFAVAVNCEGFEDSLHFSYFLFF